MKIQRNKIAAYANVVAGFLMAAGQMLGDVGDALLAGQIGGASILIVNAVNILWHKLRP